MPDLPPDAVLAAARVLGNDCHGGPPDENDIELASDALGAAWPLLPRFRPLPMSRDAARSVACPSCGAGPGELCVVMRSRAGAASYPMSTVHADRKRLAASAAENAP